MTGHSRTSGGPSGVLLVDKPDGPTSHDVVQRVRRALGVRRVGHTGTLDPFASGLLLVCVGRATRLAEYFHLLPKTYRAVVELGSATDTDDRTGRVVARSDSWRGLTPDDVKTAAGGMVGEGKQRPPAFSAKKVGGRRAYDVAREGGAVELAPVTVSVLELEVEAVRDRTVELWTRVSTGTYVRALARDLGERLGCHAHLSDLRRTEVGPYRVEQACPAAELETGSRPPDAWLSPARSLHWLPEHRLTDGEAKQVESGRPVPAPAELGDGELPVALTSGERLVGVARLVDRELRPEKVFPAE
jgi:tRNA pseudouridine55 synthase